jgi:RND family efflux transporter MFP subunit
MAQSQSAVSRPESDDFTFSSFIIRHAARPNAGGSLQMTLAATLVLAGCQAETAPVTKADRPVQVQRVNFESGESAREFVGIVRARHETDLAFRVSGKVVARLVNAGDRVRAGDVIARLDPQDLRLQTESAEAELAAATSALAQAAADLDRYTALKARGFAAIAEYDRKKAANDEADGRLARARRAVDLARNQLAYADLKADADGVITTTNVEPGQVVAIGQAVAQLAHRGEKEAVVAIPETWLGEVRESRASVRLWSDARRNFQARLRELSPQADAATRTYAARFTIVDADETVAFGMTATVMLTRDQKTHLAKLPLSAVLNRGAGPSVYVVNEAGALTLRPVTIAAFDADKAMVSSGISNGDKVVTLGVQKLVDGLKVRTIEARQ